jgi:uncharacterized cupin superfamily protein
MTGLMQDLGELAGSIEVGATRWSPEPGSQTTPVHVEGGEEEIAYLVSGAGWSWQDGKAYEVRAGDAIVHPIDGPPHTLVAGDDGLEAIVFGERAIAGTTWLPRSGTLRVQDTWVRTPGGAHPWELEARHGHVPLSDKRPRPSCVVNVDEAEVVERRRGRTDLVFRDLGRSAGSARTGLRHVTVSPGAESMPPHCHSAEEELFVVLDGGGTLHLGDACFDVGPGHVVSRPAGTRVAHSWVAGDAGLAFLAYGQRDPRDVAWYPRSRKVFVRGIGVTFRVDEPLDYWDGEE